MIKKFLVLLLVVVMSIAGVSASPASVNVLYKPNTMSANQMGFYFKIENNSGSAVQLEDLKVFYYFTLDNDDELQMANDGYLSSDVELIYHKNIFPQPGATDILEINFARGSGTLNQGQTTSLINVWITGAQNNGIYISDNDFSYDGSIDVAGACEYNRNITLYHNNELVWGDKVGTGDQNVIVGNGWYNDTVSKYMTANLNNAKVRNADYDRLEVANDGTGTKVIFDFKDISEDLNLSAVEKITLKILHHEDTVFDNDDFELTVGKGLKPGGSPEVWGSTFMPTLPSQMAEDYFEWDVSGLITSIDQINNAQLKILFDTTANGTARYNHVYMEIDYIWNGKYTTNAVTPDASGEMQVDLSYGYAWVALPQSSGTLDIITERGFDITTTGLSLPTATFPDVTPYYQATYTVTSNLVKITRNSGNRIITLKYTN